MALVKCEECGNDISTKAKTCPKCGTSAPKGSFLIGCGGFIVLIAVIGAITGGQNTSTNADHGNSQASAAPTKITCTDFTGIDAPHVQPAKFEAHIGAATQGDPYKPLVLGKTNLPVGTNLIVTLGRPESAYNAQSEAIVTKDGCFAAGPFTQGGEPINPGEYSIDVTMPALQAEKVEAIIGNRGQNLSGDFVHRVEHVGRIVEYKTVYSVGNADATKDAAAKQKAKEDADKRHEQLRLSLVMIMAKGLKENLRNPSSADWVSVLSNDDATTVCITLRAQNGFGGMTVDDYSFVNGKLSESAYVWNRHCAGKSLYDLTSIVRWTV